MNDDTVQLFIIVLFEQLGIAADSIQRDDQVTVEHIAFVVVEGDDVGIVVVA